MTDRWAFTGIYRYDHGTHSVLAENWSTGEAYLITSSLPAMHEVILKAIRRAKTGEWK